LKLSVLISIYHKEKPSNFDRAMQSIWSDQIVKPNEVILVQDGDLTNVLNGLIQKWKEKIGNDLKIIFIKKNAGLAKALNVGLEYCGGDYIARMDTDDISMPNRFKNQIEFMKNNKIDMCGSNALLINDLNEEVGVKFVKKFITFNSLIKSCDIIHPSIMVKKDFFKNYGYYNIKYIKSQDYELWLRAAKAGAIITNINDKLIKLRVSGNLIHRRKEEQKYNINIKKKYLHGMSFYLSILPNIAIMLLPVVVIGFLLKIKNRTVFS
jgi:glycosyltransferase involved in cell wall biosynthesis